MIFYRGNKEPNVVHSPPPTKATYFNYKRTSDGLGVNKTYQD